ncbi:MAG TPA: hypothetical protein VF572_02010 [Candidatus Saccharimonadales bacterium]|jgi:hypothetical protein
MNRKLILAIAVPVALVASSFVWWQGSAQAVFSTFGRQTGSGYYSGSDSGGAWLFTVSPDIPYDGISQDWQTETMDAERFILGVEQRLNSPTDYNAARASAVINMMMGVQATDPRFDGPDPVRWKNGVAIAKASLIRWEALVRAYDATGRAQWDAYLSGADEMDWRGQVSTTSSPDDPKHMPDVVAVPSTAFDNDAAIVFTNPDGTRLQMKKKNGNLSGDVMPLDQAVVATPASQQDAIALAAEEPLPHIYFDGNGGDVVAGVSFATGYGAAAVPCDAPHIGDAGIVGWNTHAAPEYAGAGNQYAAFAMGYIQDFVTSQDNNQPANGEPNGLTFANTNHADSVKLDAGLFGGMFGSAPCIDYWADRPDAVTALPAGPVSGWPDGTYYVKEDVNLFGGGDIAAGRKITLFVEGNANITGNIAYRLGGWNTRGQIPSFKLIVHGVIYIDRSVSVLDGLYAAVPESGYAGTQGSPAPDNQFSAPQKGTISTCSRPAGDGNYRSYDPTKVLSTDASMASDCAGKLTFNGTASALQLWLLRTGGSVDAGTAAETFNFGPEMWLAPAGRAEGMDDSYQSIIGLPPVL